MNDKNATADSHFIHAELTYWKNKAIFKNDADLRKCVDAARECINAMSSELVYTEEAFIQTFLPSHKND